jgi:hypothetical protein
MVAKTAAVRVTCLRGISICYGALDDRADKGSLLYQSELVSFNLMHVRVGEHLRPGGVCLPR